MIEYDTKSNPCKIIIPVSGKEEVLTYQRAILALLDIPVEKIKNTHGLKENIKIIYKMIVHMNCKENIGELIGVGKLGPEAVRLFLELHNQKYPPVND